LYTIDISFGNTIFVKGASGFEDLGQLSGVVASNGFKSAVKLACTIQFNFILSSPKYFEA
jgi:hypothetical protein